MRPLSCLVLCGALCLPGVVGAASLSEVTVQSLPGWTASSQQKPAYPALQALSQDAGGMGTRPRATRALSFSKDQARAHIIYLEYGSPADAQKAIGKLRARLWGGDTPPQGAPRLLRAGNVVAAVEAETLSVTLQVSQRLAAAGPVQDASDVSDSGTAPVDNGSSGGGDDEGPTAAFGQVPPLAAPPAVAGGVDPKTQAEIAAGLGKYLDKSAACNKPLSEKRYNEALSACRAYKDEVDRDTTAPELARWDADTSLGMASAYSGDMPGAKAAFTQALLPAGKLKDMKKIAETYFNLACAEAEMKNKDAAIGALRFSMAAAKKAGGDRVKHYREIFRTDPSLRSLQGDPRLKKIVAGR